MTIKTSLSSNCFRFVQISVAITMAQLFPQIVTSKSHHVGFGGVVVFHFLGGGHLQPVIF